jgi:hypothetical protein
MSEYTPPSPTAADLIFSGLYTPPDATQADLVFGLEEEGIRQVWTDANYVYAVTVSGLDVYDIPSEELYAYVTYSGGFSTVWANDDRVFVGTSSSGVKYLNKTCISGSVISPYNIENCLKDFSELANYPLTSSNIRYLHGNGNIVLATTDAGVDVIKLGSQSYRAYTAVGGAQKGFMTANVEFYYTVLGPKWSLNKMNSHTDWTVPDISYVTGSGIFEAGITINDIFVTESTGDDGSSNTIFAATSNGIYVIDESDNDYDIYSTEGGSGDYTILKGTSDNFAAIWADTDASLNNGKMYAGSDGYFNVVSLDDQTIYDWYSESRAGRGNEVLDAPDIVDADVT